MRFEFNFDYHPFVHEPNDVIREMTVDVFCDIGLSDEDGESLSAGEVLAARIAVDHLDMSRAREAGFRTYDVCNADSAGWERVHRILFGKCRRGEQLREEHAIGESFTQILFLHNAVFHPAVDKMRPFVFDHLARLCGHDSIAVMWPRVARLSISKLNKLGFHRSARGGLLIRANMYVNEYKSERRSIERFKLNVPADADLLVERRWKNPGVDERQLTLFR